jgi:hypothetical protein
MEKVSKQKLWATCVVSTLMSACATQREVVYVREPAPVRPGVSSKVGKVDAPKTGKTESVQAPVASSGGVVGRWSGVSSDERVSLQFGANGSLILTNSSGTESGSWSGSGGRFSIRVGEYSGSMVLLNAGTASLTLGDAHVELKRSSR